MRLDRARVRQRQYTSTDPKELARQLEERDREVIDRLESLARRDPTDVFFWGALSGTFTTDTQLTIARTFDRPKAWEIVGKTLRVRVAGWYTVHAAIAATSDSATDAVQVSLSVRVSGEKQATGSARRPSTNTAHATVAALSDIIYATPLQPIDFVATFSAGTGTVAAGASSRLYLTLHTADE